MQYAYIQVPIKPHDNIRSCHTVRCKISKYMFPSQFAKIFLTYQTFVTNLHLLRAELCCKLQEKLHRVIGPIFPNFSNCSWITKN